MEKRYCECYIQSRHKLKRNVFKNSYNIQGENDIPRGNYIKNKVRKNVCVAKLKNILDPCLVDNNMDWLTTERDKGFWVQSKRA